MIDKGLVIYIPTEYNFSGIDSIKYVKDAFWKRFGYNMTQCYVHPETFFLLLEEQKVIENVKILTDFGVQKNNFHCILDKIKKKNEEKDKKNG